MRLRPMKKVRQLFPRIFSSLLFSTFSPRDGPHLLGRPKTFTYRWYFRLISTFRLVKFVVIPTFVFVVFIYRFILGGGVQPKKNPENPILPRNPHFGLWGFCQNVGKLKV